MWQEFLMAICLVFVIEGILPFLAPAAWKQAMLQVMTMSDRNIRVMGLASMIIGTCLLYLVN